MRRVRGEECEGDVGDESVYLQVAVLACHGQLCETQAEVTYTRCLARHVSRSNTDDSHTRALSPFVDFWDSHQSPCTPTPVSASISLSPSEKTTMVSLASLMKNIKSLPLSTTPIQRYTYLLMYGRRFTTLDSILVCPNRPLLGGR